MCETKMNNTHSELGKQYEHMNEKERLYRILKLLFPINVNFLATKTIVYTLFSSINNIHFAHHAYPM